MALTKEERDKLKAELARSEAREKESDDQKWIRGAIKDEVMDTMRELLGLDDDEEQDDGKGGTKSSGGGFSITSLFGESKKRPA